MAVHSVPKFGLSGKIPRVVLDNPELTVECMSCLCVDMLLLYLNKMCCLCDALGSSKKDCRIAY